MARPFWQMRTAFNPTIPSANSGRIKLEDFRAPDKNRALNTGLKLRALRIAVLLQAETTASSPYLASSYSGTLRSRNGASTFSLVSWNYFCNLLVMQQCQLLLWLFSWAVGFG